MRAEGTDGHNTPASVMEPHIASNPAVPLHGGRESHGRGPFLKQGLYQPLGFAVGPWRVRLGEGRLEIEGPAGPAPLIWSIGKALVGTTRLQVMPCSMKQLLGRPDWGVPTDGAHHGAADDGCWGIEPWNPYDPHRGVLMDRRSPTGS